MSEQPTDPAAADRTPGEPADAREPSGSPQRRLVEQVAAYEVDPPAPERARGGAD